MAVNDSGLDVAVLTLDGFRLLAATDDDGELLMLVETTEDVVGCSGCGTRARSKGRRQTNVRDLAVGSHPAVLVWSKRVWRCPEWACEVGSWSETSPIICPRAAVSERARSEAARRVGEDGTSVAAVARSLGVDDREDSPTRSPRRPLQGSEGGLTVRIEPPVTTAPTMENGDLEASGGEDHRQRPPNSGRAAGPDRSPNP